MNNKLMNIRGFIPYILVVFFNSMLDLGHKITLQSTAFKAFDGSELLIWSAVINALILLPFIVLFSPSGFLSDRFDKTKIIRYSALSSIIITTLITISYYAGWFYFSVVLMFILAVQSAIYSPAKYGAIKELFGVENLTKTNAIVQSLVIISILLSSLFFAYIFEHLFDNSTQNPDEILTFIAPIGFILIAFSIFEYMLATKIPKTNNFDNSLKFKFSKYISGNYLVNNFKETTKHNTILFSIILLAILFSISQTIIAIFPEYLKTNLGVSSVIIPQIVLAPSGVGIMIGGFIATKTSKYTIEKGIIPLGAIGLVLSLLYIQNPDVYIIGFAFLTYGMFFGMMIIPLGALIQYYAPKHTLGKILASNNLIQSVFMFIALLLTAYVSSMGISSKYIIITLIIIAFFTSLGVIMVMLKSLILFIIKFVILRFYNIKGVNVENIPKQGGVLLLGNHISYLDWAALQIAYPKTIRFVIEKSIYNRWYVKPIFKLFNLIPISKGASKESLKEISTALKNGDTVALFPEGYLSRNGRINSFLRGYEVAVKELENATIIPFYIHGLWGSKLSHSKYKDKNKNVIVAFGNSLDITTKAIVVEQKVKDLSADIWQNNFNEKDNIAQLFIKNIKKNKRFFSADMLGGKISGKKILTMSLLIRKWLKNNTQNQQNIGIILPSAPVSLATNMSVFLLGKTAINLNYTTGISPLLSAISQAEVKTIVSSKKFIEKLKTKGIDLSEIEDKCLYFEDFKAQVSKLTGLFTFIKTIVYPAWLLNLLYNAKTTINNIATILFSSGSEGSPKGIVLTHKNLIANTHQVRYILNYDQNDKIIGTLPVFHSFGLTVCTILPAISGIPVIYHADPRDGLNIGRLTSKYKGTILLGTATFLRLYTRNSKLHPTMFASVKKVIAGAEKLQQSVREGFRQKFGLDIYEGYGASETSPVATCNTPDIYISAYSKVLQGQKHGTIGKSLPGTKIIIIDSETLQELNIGEEGMIAISGPQVMSEYLNNLEKTNEVLKKIDGRTYYLTGDKGKIDSDGFITIVDRYSRFAKIGGEMVSLSSVEEQIRGVLPDDI